MNNRFAKSFLTYLYLLQLEEYSIIRFLDCIKKRRFEPLEQFRKGIQWTQKLILIVIGSLVLQSALMIAVGIVVSHSSTVVVGVGAALLLGAVVASGAQHLSLALFVILLEPFDRAVKGLIIHRARKMIQRSPNIKIIGITGSYGKTTMKEILKSLLESRFRVLATPENVNTDIGVARFILRNLKPDIEVLVVEMGAYRPGDIRRLCSIAQPDVSVLTGINETHLERFETIERIIQTKFEIIECAKKDAYVVLNADNSYIIDNSQRFIGSHETVFYSYLNHERAAHRIERKLFLTDGSGFSFDVSVEGTACSLAIPFLGEYSIGTVDGAICVARRLGMPIGQIVSATRRFRPILHRLQPLRSQEVFIVDDSYNGNPEGVREAIQTLKSLSGKRKIYITPGLVETDIETERIHLEIGERLAGVADHVFFIRNSVTPFIAQGLERSGFHTGNIHWFSDFQTVRAGLKAFTQPGDVLLFQNDWPENYS